MKRKILFILFIISVSIPASVIAASNSMVLLAVQERAGRYTGSTASIYLDSRDGSSRVFIETFPFTKLDTQISTRFAKDISCDYFSLKCSDKDFFYTIRSNAGILGGASAGAAIAVLTTANILGDKIDDNTAITGTINSGGIIGPVAGIMEKMDAAHSKGITTVLIPAGTPRGNGSIEDHARSKNITLIRVSTLNDAYYYFTGKRLRDEKSSLTVNKEYLKLMSAVDDDLCSRSIEIRSKLKDKDDKIEELLNKSNSSKEKGHFYSSASYCFGANIIAKAELFREKNYSRKILMLKAGLLKKDIDSFKKEVEDSPKNTINDVQTAAIVMERILDADRTVSDLLKENGGSDDLAYAEERLYSAKSWYRLFGIDGKQVSINRDTLSKACIKKIQEANERYQYVSLIFPENLKYILKKIDSAESAYSRGDYEICLMEGSMAKAEADSAASTAGYGKDELKSLIDTKIGSAKESLIRTEMKGIFPILAYSYYEYAADLAGSDPYSALQYAEYSLELSSFDIYFPSEKIENKEVSKRTFLLANYILVMVMGMVAGFSLAYLLIKRR